MTATNPVGRWNNNPDFETAPDGTQYKTDIDNAILTARRQVRSFAPVENGPDMKVAVWSGALFVDGVLTEKPLQVTSAFTAPTTDPRIDRVVLDELTGDISVVTGTEAPTPVAPAIPEGKRPCAQVSLTVGMTEITSQDISDERDPGVINAAKVGTNQLKTATGSATVNGNVNANVTLNDFSFQPSLTNVGGSFADAHFVKPQATVVDPNDTIGRIALDADTGTSSDVTTVRWRYVTASRPAEIVILRSRSTGEIVGVWKSEIHDENNPPLHDPSNSDLEPIAIPKFPDRLADLDAIQINDEIRVGTLTLDPQIARNLVDDKAIIPDGIRVRQDGPVGTDTGQLGMHPLIAEAINQGRVIFKGASLGELQ